MREACRLMNTPIINILCAFQETRGVIRKLYHQLPVAPIDELDEQRVPFVFFNFELDALYVEDTDDGLISKFLRRFDKFRNLAIASDGFGGVWAEELNVRRPSLGRLVFKRCWGAVREVATHQPHSRFRSMNTPIGARRQSPSACLQRRNAGLCNLP